MEPEAAARCGEHRVFDESPRRVVTRRIAGDCVAKTGAAAEQRADELVPISTVTGRRSRRASAAG